MHHQGNGFARRRRFLVLGRHHGNLNTSEPTGYFWFTNTNNASGSDSMIAYAVCGSRGGTFSLRGAALTTRSDGDHCSGELSGREGPPRWWHQSGSEDLTVNINSTFPVDSSWSSYENNAS